MEARKPGPAWPGEQSPVTRALFGDSGAAVSARLGAGVAKAQNRAVHPKNGAPLPPGVHLGLR